MNILLLQGPMGPFFNHLADDIECQGGKAWKINFNGGDHFFSKGLDSYDFRGNLEAWPLFLEKFIHRKRIHLIVAYGDCRVYHQMAKEICARLQVSIYFFEEGYFRPNFVTFEQSGVNNYSLLPRTRGYYELSDDRPLQMEKNIGFEFHLRIFYAMIYYLYTAVLARRFPSYQHHRSISLLYEGWSWLKAGALKYPYRILSRMKYDQLISRFPAKYYLFPLQIKDDAQLKWHYSKGSLITAIDEVVRSFAQYAAPNTALMIKHHPMDRGHSHYGALIGKLVEKYGVKDRVVYLHDVPNPTLIKNSLGMVTINSTMGLSGIFHGTKVMTLGRCLYNIDGITYQGSLDSFWQSAFKPDRMLFKKFRAQVIKKTQLNQNFYKPLPNFDIDWQSISNQRPMNHSPTQIHLTMRSPRQ